MFRKITSFVLVLVLIAFAIVALLAATQKPASAAFPSISYVRLHVTAPYKYGVDFNWRIMGKCDTDIVTVGNDVLRVRTNTVIEQRHYNPSRWVPELANPTGYTRSYDKDHSYFAVGKQTGWFRTRCRTEVRYTDNRLVLGPWHQSEARWFTVSTGGW